MKQWISIAGAALILVALAAHFFTGEGEKEFKLQQQALKEVKSWRIRTQVSMNGRLIVDRTHTANCPDQESIVENSQMSSSEYRRIGDEMFWRQNSTSWKQGSVPQDLFQPFLSPRPCMTNPMEYASEINGIDEMERYIQSIINKGDFTRGELQTIGGTTCRDWTVMAFNERRQLVSTTFCVNEKDHLPRRMQTAGDAFTMTYEWGLPVSIEKPDLTVPIAPGIPQSSTATN